ncbi:hypothetical protein QNN00_01475 [Bacillus velezensis]|nr:hypothetical protein [Bacillus velezensis]
MKCISKAACSKGIKKNPGLLQSTFRVAQNAPQEYDGFSVKQTSIHTHLVLEKSLSASRVVRRLKAQGVLVEPIDSHYLSDFPKENIIKLNVSNVKTGDITRGIKMLTDCL